MFTFQDGEENGAPGGGFNQAEDNSQVDLVGWVGRGCVGLQTHTEKDCLQKRFFRSKVIFWIVTSCGTADFGWRSPQTLQLSGTKSRLKDFELWAFKTPPAKISCATLNTI